MVGRAQLVQRIAARGTNASAAGHAVQAVLDEVTAALAAGEKVTITGFGTFDPVARPERTARNPRTGAPVQVAAGVVVRFRPGTGLRAAVDAGTYPLGAVGTLPAPVASDAATTKPATTKPVAAASSTAKLATTKSAKTKDAKSKDAKSNDAKSKDAKTKDAKSKDAKTKDAKSKDAKRSPSKKDSKSKGSKH